MDVRCLYRGVLSLLAKGRHFCRHATVFRVSDYHSSKCFFCLVCTQLLNAELTVDKLTMDQIKEIVAEWQIMKKEQSPDGEGFIKEMQHAKDDLKKMVDEKDRIRKEKDRWVSLRRHSFLKFYIFGYKM